MLDRLRISERAPVGIMTDGGWEDLSQFDREITTKSVPRYQFKQGPLAVSHSSQSLQVECLESRE